MIVMTGRLLCVAWVVSAVLGVLAAALVALLLHSTPLPRSNNTIHFSEVWDDAESALNSKSNRLPLRVREPVPPSVEAVENPKPEPRELVQVAPAVVATRTVVSNLCTRHGLRKVWVNSRYWRCRH